MENFIFSQSSENVIVLPITFSTMGQLLLLNPHFIQQKYFLIQQCEIISASETKASYKTSRQRNTGKSVIRSFVSLLFCNSAPGAHVTLFLYCPLFLYSLIFCFSFALGTVLKDAESRFSFQKHLIL